MEQVVSLKNKTNRMQHINLVHPRAPRVPHTHTKLTLDAKSGKRGVRVERLGVHGSLTLLAGEEKSLLPVWVVDTPDVVRLKRQDKVSVSDPVDEEIAAAKVKAADAEKAAAAVVLREQLARKAEKKRKAAEAHRKQMQRKWEKQRKEADLRTSEKLAIKRSKKSKG